MTQQNYVLCPEKDSGVEFVDWTQPHRSGRDSAETTALMAEKQQFRTPKHLASFQYQCCPCLDKECANCQ